MTNFHELQPEPVLYTEDDFIHGNPAELIQADGEPRILTVWPHGNEHLGPKVGHHLYTARPELLSSVDYMCGNPLAAGPTPQLRYTEGIVTPGHTKEGTDLNRSFSPGIVPASYEEARAQKIVRTIEEGGYEYVLDLHTSTTDIGRCFLISERYRDDEAVRRIIAASPITRVVVLPETIAMPNSDIRVGLATTGLIGNVAGSVSIEYNRELAAEVGVEETMQLIDGLVTGRPLVTPRDREFFNVTDFILKTQDPGVEAKNFERCDYDYYPVLYGENSYRTDPSKPYLGFAATSRDVETF